MIMRSKKEEITPWQIHHESTLTSAFVISQLDTKKKQNSSQLLSQNNLKTDSSSQKRFSKIESLVRLRIEKQKYNTSSIELLKKREKQAVRQLMPLNKNLFNIIDSLNYHQNKIKSQKYRCKTMIKKVNKGISQPLKYESKVLINDHKDFLNKEKYQVQNLKRFLFHKVNSSLEILLNVKQKLSKMSEIQSGPIVRSYSVHNMKLNPIIQQEDGIFQKTKYIQREKKYHLTSTHKNLCPSLDKKGEKNQENRKKFNSSTNNKVNQHVIDRLFGKFY